MSRCAIAMHWNEPDLVPLALDAEVNDSLSALHVLDAQPAQLLAADAVIEQGGKDRAVAHALQRLIRRRIEQLSRLGVAECRRAAFIDIFDGRSIHAIDGVARHDIALAQIVEKRGESRKLAPNAGWRQFASGVLHGLAPGDHVGARHGAQLQRFGQPGKGYKLRDIDLVRTFGFLVGDVGEPFGLRKNSGEVGILGRCQGSSPNRNQP